MNKIITWVVAVAAVVALVLSVWNLVGGNQSGLKGSAAAVNQTSLTGLNLAYSVSTSTYDSNNGGFFQNGLGEVIQSGTCLTGTSTLFALQSPFAATSTVAFGEISGTGSATTSDIVVATSTTPGFALTAGTTTPAENFMGIAGIATSSPFNHTAGLTIGSGKGYFGALSALSGLAGINYTTPEKSMITMGPNDYLVGFATSSYMASVAGTGGVTASTVPSPACTYKFLWRSL